jgi:histidine triad (HIT) family protein
MACVFCDIIQGDGPGSFVYRDEIAVVLLDINPINVGHVMVIPNQHAATLRAAYTRLWPDP